MEIYYMLSQVTKAKSTCVHVKDRCHNDKRYCVDSSLLHSLGWREESNFHSSLETTFEWYVNNLDWFQK